MRREWQPEDVIACWTVVDENWRLIANNTGPIRLAFALLLYGQFNLQMDRHLDLGLPQAVR